MPPALAIAFAVSQLLVTIGVAFFASKRGVERGLQIGVAVHAEQIKALQAEIVLLRNRYHDHASHITRHEADITVLMRGAGIG